MIITNGKILPLIILYLSLPFLGQAQDCCGPGGGGGTQFIPSAGKTGKDNKFTGVGYRLKGVRHYAYSGRHPGFTAGLESAGFTEKALVNFTPRLEYFTTLQANERNNFDIYGVAFYTVFLDTPHSHQADISENVAWRFAVTENSRFVLRIDNENLFVYFPNESGIKYAVTDPSVGYVAALGFGDISFNVGFPIFIEPETGFSSWACLGYEHPIGLGVSFCPRFTLSPEASYAGTTFTLTFAWDSFYAKAALLANGDFTVFQIRPYAEYTHKHLVFCAGVELDGIREGEFSASPFIGLGYNF